MSDDIERTIDLPVTVDQAWNLIATAQGWEQWLVDEVIVDPFRSSNAGGEVADQGCRRTLSLHEFDGRRSVSFTWADPDGGDIGLVTLEVRPSELGVSIRIAETRMAGPVSATVADQSAMAWAVRALCLWAQCHALVTA